MSINLSDVHETENVPQVGELEQPAAPGGDVASLVVFQLHMRSWGLPVEAVDFVHPAVEMTPAPDAPSIVAGMIVVHGTPVPVFDLSRQMGRAAAELRVSAKLIIGHTSRRPFAIIADEVEGVVPVLRSSISSMKELIPGAGQVLGVATTPDGLLYIHDPETVLTGSEEAILSAIIAIGKG